MRTRLFSMGSANDGLNALLGQRTQDVSEIIRVVQSDLAFYQSIRGASPEKLADFQKEFDNCNALVTNDDARFVSEGVKCLSRLRGKIQTAIAEASQAQFAPTEGYGQQPGPGGVMPGFGPLGPGGAMPGAPMPGEFPGAGILPGASLPVAWPYPAGMIPGWANIPGAATPAMAVTPAAAVTQGQMTAMQQMAQVNNAIVSVQVQQANLTAAYQAGQIPGMTGADYVNQMGALSQQLDQLNALLNMVVQGSLPGVGVPPGMTQGGAPSGLPIQGGGVTGGGGGGVPGRAGQLPVAGGPRGSVGASPIVLIIPPTFRPPPQPLPPINPPPNPPPPWWRPPQRPPINPPAPGGGMGPASGPALFVPVPRPPGYVHPPPVGLPITYGPSGPPPLEFVPFAITSIPPVRPANLLFPFHPKAPLVSTQPPRLPGRTPESIRRENDLLVSYNDAKDRGADEEAARYAAELERLRQGVQQGPVLVSEPVTITEPEIPQVPPVPTQPPRVPGRTPESIRRENELLVAYNDAKDRGADEEAAGYAAELERLRRGRAYLPPSGVAPFVPSGIQNLMSPIYPVGPRRPNPVLYRIVPSVKPVPRPLTPEELSDMAKRASELRQMEQGRIERPVTEILPPALKVQLPFVAPQRPQAMQDRRLPAYVDKSGKRYWLIDGLYVDEFGQRWTTPPFLPSPLPLPFLVPQGPGTTPRQRIAAQQAEEHADAVRRAASEARIADLYRPPSNPEDSFIIRITGQGTAIQWSPSGHRWVSMMYDPRAGWVPMPVPGMRVFKDTGTPPVPIPTPFSPRNIPQGTSLYKAAPHPRTALAVVAELQKMLQNALNAKASLFLTEPPGAVRDLQVQSFDTLIAQLRGRLAVMTEEIRRVALVAPGCFGTGPFSSMTRGPAGIRLFCGHPTQAAPAQGGGGH